jgi:hypothetical protein
MFTDKTEFKNYKELCTYLEEPILAGTSKTLQLKIWSESFLWERAGHRFIITTVIKPLETRPYLRNRQSKWLANSAKLLLNRMLEIVQESKTTNKHTPSCITITTNEGYRLLGLCNNDFATLKYLDSHVVDMKHRKIFHKTVADKFYSVFNNLLVALQRYNIICFHKTYRYSTKDSNNQIIADIKQHAVIVSVLKETLEEFKVPSTWHVQLYHMEEKFYTRFNELLAVESIFNCWQVYRIAFTEYSVQDVTKFINTLGELQEAVIDINTKSILYVRSQIENFTLSDADYDTTPYELLLELTIPIK